MPDLALEPRVERLEDLMDKMVRSADRRDRQLDKTDRQLDKTDRQLHQTDRQLSLLSREMRADRAEQALERDAQRQRLAAAEARYERERAESAAEYERQRAESDARAEENRKEWRRAWGEVSNRLGTMAEDLVAPNIGRVLREVMGCPEGDVEQAVRVRRRSSTRQGRHQEFDVVAWCGDVLLVNETKSKLWVKDFVYFSALLPQVRDFFPEHAHRQVIGAISSLYVDPSLVRLGERHGLIVLGFGDDLMDVLNTKGFQPKVF